jgi:hypothetical protein
MSTEPKRTPDGREVKTIADLNPADVLVDYDDGALDDTYLTVRCVEAITAEPGRFLIVFAGGSTTNARGTTEVQLATAAEAEQHEARRRDDEKRARMRAGLVKLIDALDAGLPLPAWFRIDAGCAADEAAVRKAAEVLGVDFEEGDNGGRPIWEANSDLAPALTSYGQAEVTVRLWHLARKAVES